MALFAPQAQLLTSQPAALANPSTPAALETPATPAALESPTTPAALAVVSLSSRMLAEAAVRAGCTAVALDVFGDVDTRAAATAWHPIGRADGGVAIDAERTLAALQALAREGRAQAWVYGAGLEGLPDLVQAASEVLPLLGTAAPALRRVRDPRVFFGFLDDEGLDHPPVQWVHCPPGWLSKSAAGSGGTHITPGTSGQLLQPGAYAQQAMVGVPMSATFLANGRDAQVLGLNLQLVQATPTQPFRFRGVVGPLPGQPALQQRLQQAAQALTLEFNLRGLCSLDFLLDGPRVLLLEVNPRPSASLALYDHGPLPLMRAHVQACQGGDLPPPPAGLAVHGHATVCAQQPLHIGAQQAGVLQALGLGHAGVRVHDVPAAGTRVEAGQPICSLSARSQDAGSVQTLLDLHAATLLQTLESLT